jgi:hypothetical protein
LYDFIGFLLNDLLPIEPSLLPFFDAVVDSIFMLCRAYKKWRETKRLYAAMQSINVVVLLSIKR